jgi:hypothetical protein
MFDYSPPLSSRHLDPFSHPGPGLGSGGAARMDIYIRSPKPPYCVAFAPHLSLVLSRSSGGMPGGGSPSVVGRRDGRAEAAQAWAEGRPGDDNLGEAKRRDGQQWLPGRGQAKGRLETAAITCLEATTIIMRSCHCPSCIGPLPSRPFFLMACGAPLLPSWRRLWRPATPLFFLHCSSPPLACCAVASTHDELGTPPLASHVGSPCL